MESRVLVACANAATPRGVNGCHACLGVMGLSGFTGHAN
jgi:hypothetical protein